MSERTTGTVKWFNGAKGYGFIAPEGESEDLFVHYSEIQTDTGYADLSEGEKVEFAIEQTPKGPQAVKVVRL